MKLQLVKNDPDSAHLIFSTPGVMASTRGEIIVLERCVDVSSKVMVRYTDKCYHDLPVYNNNEKKFLSPTSKIIIDDSNQVSCENEHKFLRANRIITNFVKDNCECRNIQ